ncbi:MAG: hypothetical protein HYW48_09565 [Deltaproteobacteria bacterium]|nr:hypothetical protein [Deltaproteobacteria bacterium]
MNCKNLILLVIVVFSRPAKAADEGPATDGKGKKKVTFTAEQKFFLLPPEEEGEEEEGEEEGVGLVPPMSPERSYPLEVYQVLRRELLHSLGIQETDNIPKAFVRNDMLKTVNALVTSLQERREVFLADLGRRSREEKLALLVCLQAHIYSLEKMQEAFQAISLNPLMLRRAAAAAAAAAKEK